MTKTPTGHPSWVSQEDLQRRKEQRDHTEFVGWLSERGFVEPPDDLKAYFRGGHGANRVLVHPRAGIHVLLALDTGKGDPHFYYFYLYSGDREIPVAVSYGSNTDDIKSEITRFIKNRA